MDFQGKVVLVTGAGSGIGAASAELFARLGAKVGALSHTPAEVQRVAEGIRQGGGEAIALTADVGHPDGMERATDELASRYGGLDVVFANAGINGAIGPIDKLTVEDFDQTVRTNLRGTFVTVKAAVGHLRKRKGGAIVITSSINGNRTFNDPGSLIYSATKAAQVAMMKFLALELAKDKIRVNAVLPGSIDTEIDENTDERTPERAGVPVRYPKGEMPLTGKKPGRPEQVARLVAFLASSEADHITGAEVVIDGGQSLIV